MYTRFSMSSSSSARSRPLIENSLKPRSSTPPVSVTSPTLMLSPPPPPSSSPPQLAAPTARNSAETTTTNHVNRMVLTQPSSDPAGNSEGDANQSTEVVLRQD